MPSVDRVKAEIPRAPTPLTPSRASESSSCTCRLTSSASKYNRTIDGPYTPEELRVMGAYDLAAYQIKQDYKSPILPLKPRLSTISRAITNSTRPSTKTGTNA